MPEHSGVTVSAQPVETHGKVLCVYTAPGIPHN